VSRIEAKYSLEQCSMGKRLKIIKLGNTTQPKELLIGTRTAGSQGHVYYQNRDWRVSVTRAAVCMEEKGRGCEQGTGCIQSVSKSGMRTDTHRNTAEQLKKY